MKYNIHFLNRQKKPWTFNFNCAKQNMDYIRTFGSCKVGLALRVQNWVKTGRFGPQAKNFGLILVGLIVN